jgi:hypothetical protein
MPLEESRKPPRQYRHDTHIKTPIDMLRSKYRSVLIWLKTPHIEGPQTALVEDLPFSLKP